MKGPINMAYSSKVDKNERLRERGKLGAWVWMIQNRGHEPVAPGQRAGSEVVFTPVAMLSSAFRRAGLAFLELFLSLRQQWCSGGPHGEKRATRADEQGLVGRLRMGPATCRK